MKIKNKLLWLSVIIILLVDILSYFFAGTTERNLKVQLPLFIILIIGALLLLFSLREFIIKNKFGSIMGLIIGIALSYISLGIAGMILFVFIPFYGLIANIVECAGESCWGPFIYLSSVTLGITGIMLGAYIQHKKNGQ